MSATGLKVISQASKGRLPQRARVHKKDLRWAIREKGYVSVQPLGKEHWEVRKAEPWERFEQQVKFLLDDAGFTDVQGGRGFTLGGHQIDAAGGVDEIYLVIDCTTKHEPGFKSVKAKIDTLKGRATDIEKDVISRFTGKYAQVKFAVITKDISFTADTEDYAKSTGILLIRSEWIDEYRRIRGILGDTTKYHMLSDLGIRRLTFDGEPIPALSMDLNGQLAYTFSIEPENLLRFAYVFRRGVPSDMAYQRTLKTHRLDDIADFLEDGGFFANNIILVFKEDVRFDEADIEKLGLPAPFKGSIGRLRIPSGYCTAQIIDGQHRVYSFSKAKKAATRLPLLVTAFVNMNELDQARLFLKINQEQKSVDPNLLWDLHGQLSPEKDLGTISNLVKELHTSKGSPLRGRIWVPKEAFRKGHRDLRLSNICKGIYDRQLVREEPRLVGKDFNLWTGDPSTTKRRASRVIRGCLTAISNNPSLKDDWDKGRKGFFRSNNGINVLFRIIREMLIYKNGKIPSGKEWEKMAKGIVNWFSKVPRPLGTRTSSEGGRAEVAIEIMKQLQKDLDKAFGAKAVSDWEKKHR